MDLPEPPIATKCGTVVMLGDPNAGKSTLLNALVGEQIAIISPKPQTTWVPVLGIHTRGNCQTVFIDPPGVMTPTEPIHAAMLESVEEALAGATAALYLVPLGSAEVVPLEELLPSRRAPIVPTLVVRTKADICDPTGDPGELVVSARSGLGVDELRDWCEDKLPFAEFRYDPDDVGTQPLRFFATEFVREAAFGLLGQEMPYSVAVEVEEFREDSDPVYIRVTAYLERESQKGIFIGKSGAMIKKIGTRARVRMEGLMGARVYLDLRAKVKPKWRRDPSALRQFGYAAKPKKRKKT